MLDIFLFYVVLSSIVSIILFLWFNTSAFQEYASWFNFNNFCKLTDYEDLTKDDKSLSYPDFLANYYSNHFFIRLVSCPNCLSLWLSALINIPLLLVVFTFYGVLTLLFYPFSVLITACFALFLYYSLVKMMK
jgi:hypothetical protein